MNIRDITSLEDFNKWKPNIFKDHIATIVYENGNNCIIDFKIPETNIGAMKFIYIDGVLNINGDYGYAIFNWYNKANHISVYHRFNSIGYIMEKAVSYKESDVFRFDEDFFMEEFVDFVDERISEGYIDKIIETPYCSNEKEVYAYFNENYNLFGDDLAETNVFNLGKYMTERPYIWWFGLQSALEQIYGDAV